MGDLGAFVVADNNTKDAPADKKSCRLIWLEGKRYLPSLKDFFSNAFVMMAWSSSGMARRSSKYLISGLFICREKLRHFSGTG